MAASDRKDEGRENRGERPSVSDEGEVRGSGSGAGGGGAPEDIDDDGPTDKQRRRDAGRSEAEGVGPFPTGVPPSRPLASRS